jgi:hypothetical protein
LSITGEASADQLDQADLDETSSTFDVPAFLRRHEG